MNKYEIASYVIIGVLAIFLYFILRYHHKISRRVLKKRYNDHLKKIRQTWEKVKVPAECIDVLKLNSNIHKGEEIIEHITRTRIYLYPVIDGKIQEFIKEIEEEHTVVEFNIKARGTVDVYLSTDSCSDFYIDLDFLEKELMFNQENF